MPIFVCSFKGKEPGEIEYDEFLVEDDPDPPARWNCSYVASLYGEKLWYWVDLPKQNTSAKTYMRKHELLNRDLTCSALDMTCELSSYQKMEEEPRLPSLTRLAIEIERSRAMLAGREPRRLIVVSS